MTTPARTIADLRRITSSATHRRAVRQAEVLGLPTGLEEPAPPTRSELEDLFLNLCRRHHIPSPRVNVTICDYEVDFLWSEKRLIVETDGYRFHRGSIAFEQDRRRDLALRSQGYDVLRFTYRQVTTEAAAVGEAVLRALEAP